MSSGDRQTVSNDSCLLKFSLPAEGEIPISLYGPEWGGSSPAAYRFLYLDSCCSHGRFHMHGGMHPDYTHRRVHFSCLFEEKLEGSSGDYQTGRRVVFSLLDECGSTIELDPDSAGHDRSHFVTVGMKAMALNPAALDSVQTGGVPQVARAARPACGDRSCRDPSCAIDNAVPEQSRVAYKSWGAFNQFREALGTPLLPHELLGFLLRFCGNVSYDEDHGNCPGAPLWKQHWVAANVQAMFPGTTHFCDLSNYCDDDY